MSPTAAYCTCKHISRGLSINSSHISIWVVTGQFSSHAYTANRPSPSADQPNEHQTNAIKVQCYASRKVEATLDHIRSPMTTKTIINEQSAYIHKCSPRLQLYTAVHKYRFYATKYYTAVCTYASTYHTHLPDNAIQIWCCARR